MNQRRKTGNKEKQAIQDKAEQAGVSRGDKTQTSTQQESCGRAVPERICGPWHIGHASSPGERRKSVSNNQERDAKKWRHGTQFETTGDQSEGKRKRKPFQRSRL